jgi:hypothetical protein
MEQPLISREVRVRRWLNWLYMKDLIESLGTAEADRAMLYDPGHSQLVKKAILSDGSRLNLRDPAVALFFRMTEVDPSEGWTLRESVKKLIEWHRFDLKIPGIERYHSPDLERLANLRFSPNGWAELDRLICHLSKETMTEKAARIDGNIVYNKRDPGLGGARCYSLNLLVGKLDDNPYRTNIALASSPMEAMKLLDHILVREGDRFRGAVHRDAENPAPVGVYLKRNGKTEFLLPIMMPMTSESSLHGNEVGTACLSSPEFDWSDIDWHRHDQNVFKAVIQHAPQKMANKIKGTFLSDELGM